MYTVSQKNCATILSFTTLANVGRFSKFFHCYIKKFAIETRVTFPTTQICRCTTLRNLKFKIQPFSVTDLQTYLKSIVYVFRVIKV